MAKPRSGKTPPHPADARSGALALLEAVLDDRRPLDDAFDAAVAGLEPRDRAFTRAIAATALRRKGEIDRLIKGFSARPIPRKHGRLKHILRVGLAQLLFLGVPAHAAVATTVELARRHRFDPQAGFVNALMRRADREGRDRLERMDAARLNTPDWLWQGWSAAYGEDTARAIATAHLLAGAPLDISVKAGPESGADVESWAERLDATRLPTGSLRLADAGSVAALPGFDAGAWWVQDAAAALPARLLGDVTGLRVADLCAAPGGKTAQLAAAGAHVTALDRSAQRLERLGANMKRLGLAVETLTADATTWRPDRPMDAVLLDAPCSATGTIRRHPDVPRLKDPDGVRTLAQGQALMLEAAAEQVAPGGLVVYCVCSLQAEEGPEVIRAALERLPFERVALDAGEVGGMAELITSRGDLRTLPCHLAEHGGMDGFYAARLRRT